MRDVYLLYKCVIKYTMSQHIQLKKSVTRQVVFPQKLYNLIEVRLNQLGISTPEYIRQLVIEDVKPLYKDLPLVDLKTEISIAAALKEKSNSPILSTKKDVQKYLDSIVE